MRQKNRPWDSKDHLFILFLIFIATVCHGQQTYLEQSSIDLFGKKYPIFNYMPNAGHVDVERLDHYQQTADLREEEGSHSSHSTVICTH